MHDWIALVRLRLRELGADAPPPDLVEELALHLAQVYEDARANDARDPDAKAAALKVLDASHPLLQALQAKQLPRHGRVREWARRDTPVQDERGGWMSRIEFTRDARHGVRMLLRTPAFSLIAILTFAVGLGVNTAVFSVLNGVLLRALPYPGADRITLVWLDNRREHIKDDITSYPNYLDWRDQNTTYAELAAFSPTSFSLTGAGEPERLLGAAVTANFFEVMGIQPAIGRVFGPASEVEGRDGVAVLSRGLWRRRFGEAPDVLGRTIVLNGTPREIIGVMPDELRWPDRAEVWTPLAPAQNAREARSAFWLPVIGRLKPGVAVERAQADLGAISARLEEQYPSNRGFGANVVPLKRQIIGNIQPALLVLMGAVGFVLLIACANLTNLMLGRTAARRKELAIRNALGAGRGRIVRQIVTEALVLAAIGGAAGVALAYGAVAVFLRVGRASIPRPEAISIDGRVLGFAFALAGISALVAALVPALHASRAAVADHLREGGRQGGPASNRRTRSMQAVDRGFSDERIAVATVSPPPSSYPEASDLDGSYARLLERVRRAPGVESAALGSRVLLPLVTTSGIFSIEGRPLPPPEERIEYPFEVVSPGFIETLGMQIVGGRSFSAQDTAQAPGVVVINETLARLGWPGQDPIGRHIRSGSGNSQAPWMTVVGVMKDARLGDVTRTVRPALYMCSLQVTRRTLMIVARTAGDAPAILPTLRRELQALDPQLPLFRAGTLAGEVSDTLSQPRFQATLLGGFAVIALILAVIGIYGVTSHAVGQRTQEVGIRIALGASRGRVLGLMLGQHLVPAAAGLAAGIAGAVALNRYLRSLLYGVGANDPVTFTVMAAALFVVAVVACWIPARRAMRVDPLVALRAE